MTPEEEAQAEHEAKWAACQRAPKFRHITRELEGIVERESYIYSTPAGAIELWRAPYPSGSAFSRSGHFGGVEVHSPKPLYGPSQNPMDGHCAHVRGGKCYTDGSSMAFDEFEDCFNLPDYIKIALAERHAEQFGEDGHS